MEFIGWIGAFTLALCGIPQAMRSYREGHANGVDGTFLVLWTVGEIASLAYVLSLGDLPLTVNYLANVGSCLVISYYKWR
jgi:uncharacterized protein with PQ loop repeat